MALCLAAAMVGCDRGDSGTADAAPAAVRRERMLPAFEGPRVGGGRLSTDLLQGKRAVIVVFSERDALAGTVGEMVARIQPEAAGANVALLGVSRDRDEAAAARFARRHGLEFPIVMDASGLITRKLPVRPNDSSLLIVDAEGFIISSPFAELQPGLDASHYEDRVRHVLRLDSDRGGIEPALGLYPPAPPFELRGLDRPSLTLASLEGRAVVLVFFLHTCPHCHEALGFLQELAAELDTEDLAVVAVSVVDAPEAVRSMAEQLDLDLPFYLDPTRVVVNAYEHDLTVPDTVLIDRSHRVVARYAGIDARTKALLAMAVRRTLGAPNPILLVRDGYSGEDTCRVCHGTEHATWALTNHAYAFDTLVEHGADRDAECLPCHTVGWGEQGGYGLDLRSPHLEGVQCESCHGRGGPHQSPDFLAAGFEGVCQGCHTPQHSLRFDFADRLPLVSHAANRQFDGLTLEERRALIERRDKRKRTLFEDAPYVGSDACQSCHAAEHERWSRSPHARAFATLVDAGEAENADCQRCHTTGFEHQGGFPGGGEALRDVGCESCHGPGGNHVAPDAPKSGTSLALTDKCESCVILQICGSCHDDANDPNFEFEVVEKIDRIRHGFRDREAPAE